MSMIKANLLLLLSAFAAVKAQRGSNLRRLLSLNGPSQSHHFFNLHDPRTVKDKSDAPEEDIGTSVLTAETMPRPLNILSFGTSQTYGHGLDHPQQSYPYRVTPYVDHVDNLALPATAADHPSLCLQSLMPDSATKNYDLILVEYPSNQSDGLRLLMKRLRERYPDAVIVFVEIWNLLGRLRVEGTNKMVHMVDDRSSILHWEWKEGDTFSSVKEGMDCVRELCHMSELEALLEEVDAYYYTLDNDVPADEFLERQWFLDDWHHLSVSGHYHVANGVAQLLARDPTLWQKAFSANKRLGTWSMGDQCYNWFFSGDVQVDYKETEAELKCASPVEPRTCSLNVKPENKSGATITFQSHFDGAVPVAIGYITQGHPDVFPTVKVTLNENTDDVRKVNPDLDRTTRVNPKGGARITSYIHIGDALPGLNTLHVQPVEFDTELPFEMVGIYLCGACKHVQNGHMGIGALNMDNNGQEQRFDKSYVKSIMGYP